VNVVDTSKRLDNRAFGDTQAGWYWRGVEGPDLAGMQAQHDAYAALLKKEGVEVVYLDENRRRPNEVLLHAGLLYSDRGRRNRYAVWGPAHQAAGEERRGDAHPCEDSDVPSFARFSGSWRGGKAESFAWLNNKTRGHRSLSSRGE